MNAMPTEQEQIRMVPYDHPKWKPLTPFQVSRLLNESRLLVGAFLRGRKSNPTKTDEEG